MKFLSQINVNTEYTLPIVDGSNGQVLTTDGNGAVYWGSVSAGSTNLNALTDVIITSPQVDQILVYRIPLGESIPVWMNVTSPYAPLASPTFTGIPSAPTAPTATNTTQIATTAFVKAQGYITSAQATNLYVPYDGAISDVDLGENTLLSRNIVVNHASGSGVAVSITKGGNGEALTVVKSSGSGNAASITGGVTLLTTLHLTNRLADDYISSAVNWNTAYNDRITAASVTGTGTKTLTLTQGDSSTITATWVDYDTDTDAQTLTWTKATSSISISNGNSVTLEGLATEEYVTSQGYITSYTETDTLNSVTSRGNTTVNGISVGSLSVPSYIYLTNGGAPTFISESWGINLNGQGTQPVQVRSASLSVGYTLGGGTNYGTSNLYVAGSVGFGTTTPTQKLEVSGGAIIASGFGNRASGTGKALEIGMDGTSAILQAYDRTASAYIPIIINSSAATFNGSAYASNFWATNYGPRDSNGNINFVDWSSNVIARINRASGVTSVGNRKLSLGILDINSQGTPEVRINTKIPFALGGADFTVNIKGFQYGSSNMVSLSIGWHYYLSQFYNETAISNGAFAPTITLGVDENNLVVIHLSNVGYWPKLYVESVYSSAYADDYISNWSWADAGIDGLSNTAIVPYKPLDTSITGNAAYASSAGNSSTTSQTNFSTLTVSNNTVATQAWVTSQGYLSGAHTHSASDITSGTLSTDRLPKQELGISIVGNFGQWQPHTAYQNLNTDVSYWGWTFVQGNANAPHGDSQQWYRGRFSLGDEYGFGTNPGDYWMEIAIPRYNLGSNSGNLFVRTCENGGINAWQGVRAAFATDADTLDGYHETSFIRLAANSSSPTNGTFAIGSASGRNFIQSHSGQPLDINPLGNAVNVGSTLTVSGTVTASGGNSSNWNTAYGWGNHAVYGYWNINDTDTKSVQSELVRFVGDVEVQGTFTESSSIRFKENIKPLEPALGKVEQLNPVTYNKIGVVEEEIGLIAEEVAELFPEVVTYNEEGQPQGIQYQRLSVILLKAVQELTERVNKLENK